MDQKRTSGGMVPMNQKRSRGIVTINGSAQRAFFMGARKCSAASGSKASIIARACAMLYLHTQRNFLDNYVSKYQQHTRAISSY